VTQRSRQEYTVAVHARYAASDRASKGRILDEYCRTTGCHRKAAIRALRRPARRPAGRPGRPRQYDRALVTPLERLWEISDHLCGKLLVAALPTLLPALERHDALALSPAHRQQLLALSPATLDRLLAPVRARRGRQPYRASPATSALKQQIPIRTWSDWAAARPGALQGDLVLHCGDLLDGFFLASLVGVDVASGWIELEPIWGLGQHRVGAGIEYLRQRLPIPLREWHTDNGSEFLNHGLVDYCRRHAIQFTRGRGYRKNDQAWVELRNWLAVRRLVGRDRYSSRAAFALLHRLYRLLRLQLNFFRPFRKLVHRRRRGSKRLTQYDRAQTPYQRLLAADVLTDAQRAALQQQFTAVNPATLARDIADTLERLWKCADARRPGTASAAR
jgi:hypothetical protein